jgi:hypothetical protein
MHYGGVDLMIRLYWVADARLELLMGGCLKEPSLLDFQSTKATQIGFSGTTHLGFRKGFGLQIG